MPATHDRCRRVGRERAAELDRLLEILGQAGGAVAAVAIVDPCSAGRVETPGRLTDLTGLRRIKLWAGESFCTYILHEEKGRISGVWVLSGMDEAPMSAI